jgi:hypothetical protein
MDDTTLNFAASEIQAYVCDRPDAADTAEGIHRAWIRWPDLPGSIELTLAALRQLELGGRIERARVGNREIWRRPRNTVE